MWTACLPVTGFLLTDGLLAHSLCVCVCGGGVRVSCLRVANEICGSKVIGMKAKRSRKEGLRYRQEVHCGVQGREWKLRIWAKFVLFFLFSFLPFPPSLSLSFPPSLPSFLSSLFLPSLLLLLFRDRVSLSNLARFEAFILLGAVKGLYYPT